MSPAMRRLYFQVRRASHGYSSPPGKAVCDLETARILRRWEALESMGLVRLDVRPDDFPREPCDCSDPRCPAKRADRESLTILGHYSLPRVDSQGYWEAELSAYDRWPVGGAIGGNEGHDDPGDWRQNEYVIEVMRETIEAFRTAWKDRVHGRHGRRRISA